MSRGLGDVYKRQVELASKFHQKTHTNKAGLIKKFAITHGQAPTILRQCPQWSIVQAYPYPPGVNPRGDKANMLWQIDVTHAPSSGKLSYVHCSNDTQECHGLQH